MTTGYIFVYLATGFSGPAIAPPVDSHVEGHRLPKPSNESRPTEKLAHEFFQDSHQSYRESEHEVSQSKKIVVNDCSNKSL